MNTSNIWLTFTADYKTFTLKASEIQGISVESSEDIVRVFAIVSGTNYMIDMTRIDSRGGISMDKQRENLIEKWIDIIDSKIEEKQKITI